MFRKNATAINHSFLKFWQTSSWPQNNWMILETDTAMCLATKSVKDLVTESVILEKH